jgi:hypothetical protein
VEQLALQAHLVQVAHQVVRVQVVRLEALVHQEAQDLVGLQAQVDLQEVLAHQVQAEAPAQQEQVVVQEVLAQVLIQFRIQVIIEFLRVMEHLTPQMQRMG